MDFDTCNLEIKKYLNHINKTYIAKDNSHSITIDSFKCLTEIHTPNVWYIYVHYINNTSSISGTIRLSDFLKNYSL